MLSSTLPSVSSALTELDNLVMLGIKLPRCSESFEHLSEILHNYSISSDSDAPRLRSLLVKLDHRSGLTLETEDQWGKLDAALQGPRFKLLIRVAIKCIKEVRRDGKPVIRDDGNPELEDLNSEEAEEWRYKLKRSLPLTLKRNILFYEPGTNMSPRPV